MGQNRFHRVLIAATILFDIGCTFWAIRYARIADGAIELAMVAGLALLTNALVVYLVYFNRNLAMWRHILGGLICPKCQHDLSANEAAGPTNCPECGAMIREHLHRRTTA